jgi:hypothetical protein
MTAGEDQQQLTRPADFVTIILSGVKNDRNVRKLCEKVPQTLH